MLTGQICQSLSGFYDVIANGKRYRTQARGNFRKKKIKPVVGDRVAFANRYILKVLPRRNRLSRPPLANVDQAIVVTSVYEPRFSSGLLNRQLITLAVQHIQPVLYFSKMDRLSPDHQSRYVKLAAAYHQIGYPVSCPKRPFSPASLKLIKQRLPHAETVVMGQTGAGKSTLLNHLVPGLDLKTGSVSRSLHRGKHTTRRVHLIPINSGLVADTPGFSSYQVLHLNYRHLKNYFPEFVRNSNRCRFRECLHFKEPGCEIKKLVQTGRIMKSRYQTYVRLLKALKKQELLYWKKKK